MTERPELRAKMGEAAAGIARAAGYVSAGTMEFLVTPQGDFYFLEMNTRLQVEHPVTELVTGLDLVEWQLRIAAGERLTIQQEDVTWRGSAIECRIYAEDPDQGFLPSPGKIARLSEPSGPGIRLDSGVYEGWTVPLEYDPLLAKLAAWAPTREGAMGRLERALSEYSLSDVRNNIGLFREILADPQFREGKLSTTFLERFLTRRPSRQIDLEAEAAAALVLALFEERPASLDRAINSRWTESGREALLR
jgi:acetyl-CoA carboxylase biotin carboxylase subunit